MSITERLLRPYDYDASTQQLLDRHDGSLLEASRDTRSPSNCWGLSAMNMDLSHGIELGPWVMCREAFKMPDMDPAGPLVRIDDATSAKAGDIIFLDRSETSRGPRYHDPLMGVHALPVVASVNSEEYKIGNRGIVVVQADFKLGHSFVATLAEVLNMPRYSDILTVVGCRGDGQERAL